METIIYLISIVVGVILALIFCIPVFIAYALKYILEGIALNQMAKLRPAKNLWLNWIPYAVEYACKNYIFAQMSNEDSFRLFGGRLTFKNKLVPFWIYLGVYATVMLTSFVSILISWIPILGFVVLAFYLLVVLIGMPILGFIEFVYLRDLLNVYKPDRKANVTTAILLTIFNYPTFGLARAIYLFRMKNDLPLE
jgi:hypothetical protein